MLWRDLDILKQDVYISLRDLDINLVSLYVSLGRYFICTTFFYFLFSLVQLFVNSVVQRHF